MNTPHLLLDMLDEQAVVHPATYSWLRSEGFSRIERRYSAPDTETFQQVAKINKFQIDRRHMPALDFYAADSEKHPNEAWLVECRVRFGMERTPRGKGWYEATLKAACSVLRKHGVKQRMAYPDIEEQPFREILVVPVGALTATEISYCQSVWHTDVHEIFFPQVFQDIAPLLQGNHE